MEAVGLPLGEATVGFREIACSLGGFDKSFRRTAQQIAALGIAELSHETVRRIIEQEGDRIDKARQDAAFTLDWAASPNEQAEVICVGVDGVMTPRVSDQAKRKRRRRTAAKRGARARKSPDKKPLPKLPKRKAGADGPWKEMKIVGVYTAEHDPKHWHTTHLDHRMAGVLMGRVSRKAGLRHARSAVAIVDGAEWISRQLRERVPELEAIILDFFHLSEHVHDAARTIFGESNPKARRWAGQLLSTIKHEGLDAFNRLLQKTMRAFPAADPRRAALTSLEQYVNTRHEMVDYPHYLSRGWPIGSGPTESMAGQLTHRVKQAGMRWDGENCQSMMSIAALDASGEWQQYWKQQRKIPA